MANGKFVFDDEEIARIVTRMHNIEEDNDKCMQEIEESAQKIYDSIDKATTSGKDVRYILNDICITVGGYRNTIYMFLRAISNYLETKIEGYTGMEGVAEAGLEKVIEQLDDLNIE